MRLLQHKFRERHYAKSATRRRVTLRAPAHPGRIVGCVLAAVAVVAGALVWGNHLKAESDAYRADREAGRWTLGESVATPMPAAVPEVHLVEIIPEGNVGDILIAGSHDGVILPIRDSEGRLNYHADVAEEAGLVYAPEAVSLADDVARVSRRGLHVTCVFEVTAFADPEADAAVTAYRRGLELALLRAYAAAGANDLLLLGLPAGSDAADRKTVAFLTELTSLLADLEEPPAVGVALPLSSLAGEEQPYAGNLTPGRIRSACQYLALDLRGEDAASLESLLPDLQYAYVRHSLRLLCNKADGAAVEVVLGHGFMRVFEMNGPELTASETANE